jgi:hypothetical protein
MSSFWALGDEALPGLHKLADDVASGAWERRYAHLLELEERDCGYRLVVAQGQEI